MTRESGPHRERPDDYHGIPQVARLRYADGDVVQVATATPEQGAADWSVQARGDTLRLGWPAHRMIWGLMFDMTSEGEGYRGAMNPLDWTWLGLLLAILGYWVVTISWWVMRQRQKARAPEVASVTQLSETEIVVTFEDRINLIRVGVVLLGPPLVLVLVWLLGRS